jgi:Meiotically up-regulated gene 113
MNLNDQDLQPAFSEYQMDQLRRLFEGGCIYFVQAVISGKVKIGFSKKPLFRIAQLRTSSSEELTILGFVFGSRQDEKIIHRHFAKDRLIREWFNPSDSLLRFVQEHDVFKRICTGKTADVFFEYGMREIDNLIETFV